MKKPVKRKGYAEGGRVAFDAKVKKGQEASAESKAAIDAAIKKSNEAAAVGYKDPLRTNTAMQGADIAADRAIRANNRNPFGDQTQRPTKYPESNPEGYPPPLDHFARGGKVKKVMPIAKRKRK